MAHGFANDALTAIALATRAPILIAPAMNGKMWQHPATLRNVETLRGFGARFVEPAEGLLACGYEGVGRLAEVDVILRAVEETLRVPQS
jgi:phosphopantothenoylcysteine synthetase/decarboxylase